MKIVVDHLPTSPRECPYGSNSTGKYRCKFDAHLCPIVRGGECPYLTDTIGRQSVISSTRSEFENRPDPNTIVDKKTTGTRRKTNKV